LKGITSACFLLVGGFSNALPQITLDIEHVNSHALLDIRTFPLAVNNKKKVEIIIQTKKNLRINIM